MTTFQTARNRLARVEAGEREFRALMANEDYDNPRVESLEIELAEGRKALGGYVARLLDALDERDKALRALLEGDGWFDVHIDADEATWITCGYCDRTVQMQTFQCDHEPDCPVKIAKGMVE